MLYYTSPGSQIVVVLQCSGRSTLLQEEHSTERHKCQKIKQLKSDFIFNSNLFHMVSMLLSALSLWLM